jgi:hypothetical protein
MKSLTTQLTFAAALTVLAITANAGSEAAQFANIPVNFHVGDHFLPAGKYTIREITPGYFAFSNQNAAASAIVPVPLPVAEGPREAPHVTLKTYGTDRWRVAEVYSLTAGRTLGRCLNKKEREFDKLSGPSNALLVPLSTLR